MALGRCNGRTRHRTDEPSSTTWRIWLARREQTALGRRRWQHGGRSCERAWSEGGTSGPKLFGNGCWKKRGLRLANEASENRIITEPKSTITGMGGSQDHRA